MSRSNKSTKSSISVWSFFLIIVMLYIVGLFVTHQLTTREGIYWSGYDLQVQKEQGKWLDSNRMEIGSEDGIQNIRFSIQIDGSDIWNQPVSIMLGGPFSAQILWDGNVIGNKGTIGDHLHEEVAGPIDFSTLVPSILLKPGNHQLQIKISTQHLLMTDNSVLHYVWLAPYRHDGQRNMRYYTVPLIIFSGLLVLSFQSIRIGRNAGNQIYNGLGIYGFLIVLSLIAEVARASVNYPYNFHELRSVIGWCAIMGAALILVFTSYRITRTTFSKIGLAVGLVAVLFFNFWEMNSEDLQLALGFILTITASSLVFIHAFIKKKISYLCSLPIFYVASLISISLSVDLFLDSFLFIASIILIGGAWLWAYVDVRQQSDSRIHNNSVEYFTVKIAGENQYIPVADCYALKAEGNYTSLMQVSGETVLHQDGIGTILDTLPAYFVRVHKSFAVNLNMIVALKSSTGSKYWVEMSNKENIPVSRYRVAELRSLLNGKPCRA